MDNVETCFCQFHVTENGNFIFQWPVLKPFGRLGTDYSSAKF